MMSAGGIICLVILLLCGLLFVALGISQYRSKEPVAFYSGEKAPEPQQLTNVREWNRGHGLIWITYGIVLALTGIFFPMVLLSDSMISAVIYTVFIVGEIIPAIIYHHMLIKKYKKR